MAERGDAGPGRSTSTRPAGGRRGRRPGSGSGWPPGRPPSASTARAGPTPWTRCSASRAATGRSSATASPTYAWAPEPAGLLGPSPPRHAGDDRPRRPGGEVGRADGCWHCRARSSTWWRRLGDGVDPAIDACVATCVAAADGPVAAGDGRGVRLRRGRRRSAASCWASSVACGPSRAVEGVRADNNAAERALRHGVIWRKTEPRHRQRGGEPVRGADAVGGGDVPAARPGRAGLPDRVLPGRLRRADGPLTARMRLSRPIGRERLRVRKRE